MVTNNIEEAVFLGQKIIVMNKGGIKSIIDNKYFGILFIRKFCYYLWNRIFYNEFLDDGGL